MKNLPSTNHLPELKIGLQTNGLLMTPEMWDSLGDAAKMIDLASISVDAATESTYRLNRGGDWSKLLANLKWIAESEIQCNLNFVIQENNMEEMEAFVELARKYKVSIVYFSTLENWGSYTEEEFARRAVQRPSHLKHQRCLEILRRPLFQSSTEPKIFIAGDLGRMAKATS
jgi:MoaA/NifB/PqqE/SkfB family radical SAM enzyme